MKRQCRVSLTKRSSSTYTLTQNHLSEAFSYKLVCFLTPNYINLSIESCRRVVSPGTQHWGDCDPLALTSDVLPGLCGGPGVGLRPSWSSWESERVCFSHSNEDLADLCEYFLCSKGRFKCSSFVTRQHQAIMPQVSQVITKLTFCFFVHISKVVSGLMWVLAGLTIRQGTVLY